MKLYTQKYNGTIYVDTDSALIDMDDILNEVDTVDITAHLLTRDCEFEPDSAKTRKLIVKLMGLPEWYHSDKDGLCREIEKLF
jgi:hypothetical protein